MRGSGLSLLSGATSLARLLASIVFGALWTVVGLHDAVLAFALALAAVGIPSAVVLVRARERVA